MELMKVVYMVVCKIEMIDIAKSFRIKKNSSLLHNRIKQVPDPELRKLLKEIAKAMDEGKWRNTKTRKELR